MVHLRRGNCVGPLVETPPAWRHQREQSAKAAIRTVEKLQVRHGDTPVGDWAEEDRILWNIAGRILGEADGSPWPPWIEKPAEDGEVSPERSR
jgi:hypothetical protein